MNQSIWLITRKDFSLFKPIIEHSKKVEYQINHKPVDNAEDFRASLDSLSVDDVPMLVLFDGSLAAELIDGTLNYFDSLCNDKQETHKPSFVVIESNNSNSRPAQLNNMIDSRTIDELTKFDIFDHLVSKSEILFLSKRHHIIAESESFLNVLQVVRKYSQIDYTPILLLGDSGTGKGKIAKAIHFWGSRSEEKFVHVDLPTIPDSLFESTLFGAVPGAFTGAPKIPKPGLCEKANNGILFLDEIGELSPENQAKILQLVQEKTFLPVGANEYRTVNIRIIAATNQNLEEFVSEKRFREDLYYRLNMTPVKMPLLRDRRADIEPLTNFFINRFCIDYAIGSLKYDDALINIFNTYHWPGNIRQLKGEVYRLCILAEQGNLLTEKIDEKILNPTLESKTPKTTNFDQDQYKNTSPKLKLDDRLEENKKYLKNVLSMYSGNVSKASKHLNDEGYDGFKSGNFLRQRLGLDRCNLDRVNFELAIWFKEHFPKKCKRQYLPLTC